jgi:hypothetical protein
LRRSFQRSGQSFDATFVQLRVDRGHARNGSARNRRMVAMMARTIEPVTVTSAGWKVMVRA